MHRLLASTVHGSRFADTTALLNARTDSECWLLTLLILVIAIVAIPNLRNVSRPTLRRILICALVVQPFLLVLFRWPLLASAIWAGTQSLTLATFMGALPGLMLLVQISRTLNVSMASWAPLLVAMSVCGVFDLAATFGVIETVGQFDMQSKTGAPWGLLVTLVVAGWLSSLLIPYWFLWCSDSELLVDERSAALRILWNRFHSRPPKIYLWPTGCRAANAVLLGTWLSKKLLITDKLLLSFHQRELEWIALHELAHSTRRHHLVRLIPTAVALPALYLMLSGIDGLLLSVGCVFLFFLFAGLIAATCWWTEWDADAQAIRYGGRHLNQSLLEASQEYSAVLRKLYHTNNSDRTSWTHPSLKHRLNAIEKLTRRECGCSSQ